MTSCRCGYDGVGVHRCHAGRPDPATREDGSRWCERPATTRLVCAGMPSLGGMQSKFGAVEAHYCDDHHQQILEVLR